MDIQTISLAPPDAQPAPLDEPPIRVMALHALLYCERLFYLEEVEEIRVADAAVYAGRRLHDDVVSLDDETPEQRSLEVSSDQWGIFGKVDAVRRRDGVWVAYEHKRGRCRRGENKTPLAWPSDRIQAVAYAVLLEEALGEPVPQARVRYHADNVTAFVDVDQQARDDLRQAIERARQLRLTTARPPVTENENLCRRCSLAPVCLPEEERLVESSIERGSKIVVRGSHDPVLSADLVVRGSHDPVLSADLVVRGSHDPVLSADGISPASDDAHDVAPGRPVPTLFPSNRERQTLYVTAHNAYVSRSGQSLVVTTDEGTEKFPIGQLDSLVIHGFAQVTTQAIHLCAWRGVAVQWLTAGGKFSAGTSASPGRVQQRIRQYAALADDEFRLRMARQLVHAKVETQLRYLLRATRGNPAARQASQTSLERIREALKKIPTAGAAASLLGFEGIAAKAYFACLPLLLASGVADTLRPQGRSKHPPRDRFNCALSFGYALIQSLVQRSILGVGLEPAFGFYHQPRTAAPPLVLDLMELFRTALWEMPLIGSVNRGQWNPDEDFEVHPSHVWLSDSGRKKALQLFEQRLGESHKHPHTGQSLSYARMVELEVRLLEKEWTGCPGLFAQMRMR